MEKASTETEGTTTQRFLAFAEVNQASQVGVEQWPSRFGLASAHIVLLAVLRAATARSRGWFVVMTASAHAGARRALSRGPSLAKATAPRVASLPPTAKAAAPSKAGEAIRKGLSEERQTPKEKAATVVERVGLAKKAAPALRKEGKAEGPGYTARLGSVAEKKAASTEGKASEFAKRLVPKEAPPKAMEDAGSGAAEKKQAEATLPQPKAPAGLPPSKDVLAEKSVSAEKLEAAEEAERPPPAKKTVVKKASAGSASLDLRKEDSVGSEAKAEKKEPEGGRGVVAEREAEAGKQAKAEGTETAALEAAERKGSKELTSFEIAMKSAELEIARGGSSGVSQEPAGAKATSVRRSPGPAVKALAAVKAEAAAKKALSKGPLPDKGVEGREGVAPGEKAADEDRQEAKRDVPKKAPPKASVKAVVKKAAPAAAAASKERAGDEEEAKGAKEEKPSGALATRGIVPKAVRAPAPKGAAAKKAAEVSSKDLAKAEDEASELVLAEGQLEKQEAEEISGTLSETSSKAAAAKGPLEVESAAKGLAGSPRQKDSQEGGEGAPSAKKGAPPAGIPRTLAKAAPRAPLSRVATKKAAPPPSATEAAAAAEASKAQRPSEASRAGAAQEAEAMAEAKSSEAGVSEVAEGLMGPEGPGEEGAEAAAKRGGSSVKSLSPSGRGSPASASLGSGRKRPEGVPPLRGLPSRDAEGRLVLPKRTPSVPQEAVEKAALERQASAAESSEKETVGPSESVSGSGTEPQKKLKKPKGEKKEKAEKAETAQKAKEKETAEKALDKTKITSSGKISATKKEKSPLVQTEQHDAAALSRKESSPPLGLAVDQISKASAGGEAAAEKGAAERLGETSKSSAVSVRGLLTSDATHGGAMATEGKAVSGELRREGSGVSPQAEGGLAAKQPVCGVEEEILQKGLSFKQSVSSPRVEEKASEDASSNIIAKRFAALGSFGPADAAGHPTLQEPSKLSSLPAFPPSPPPEAPLGACAFDAFAAFSVAVSALPSKLLSHGKEEGTQLAPAPPHTWFETRSAVPELLERRLKSPALQSRLEQHSAYMQQKGVPWRASDRSPARPYGKKAGASPSDRCQEAVSQLVSSASRFRVCRCFWGAGGGGEGPVARSRELGARGGRTCGVSRLRKLCSLPFAVRACVLVSTGWASCSSRREASAQSRHSTEKADGGARQASQEVPERPLTLAGAPSQETAVGGKWEEYNNLAEGSQQEGLAQGYYDEQGNWVAPAPGGAAGGGYWDESGNWVGTGGGYYGQEGYVQQAYAGYYDEQGNWVQQGEQQAQQAYAGYYDEQGNWVATSAEQQQQQQPQQAYAGYYDEQGNWVQQGEQQEGGYWGADGNWTEVCMPGNQSSREFRNGASGKWRWSCWLRRMIKGEQSCPSEGARRSGEQKAYRAVIVSLSVEKQN
ncbi:nascent polypeptide-associated complex subunit alpha, muscle-specific form [Cyclospora cayetanensis]|uniref:Nascent polypeptide-associated complex subunit alpha, muscle-specific form n=1 Tax=Cyclospora cayetanensis TaxID=88456 RepID=A0A6P6RXI6_9EIME|nr:nascent polypeptide-associated complex subunit alpha, muscle-specific form [Cyclospora cayetanensis]